MDGRYEAPSLSVRLAQEDQQFLATFAQYEGMSVAALVAHAVWHFRTWQQRGKQALEEALELIDLLSRECRTHERRRWYLQRRYENQLRYERAIRRVYQQQLQHERAMRRTYERQLRRQGGSRVRPSAAPQASTNAPYSPKVARLLALAVCSGSDGEAMAAFAKARALHRVAN